MKLQRRLALLCAVCALCALLEGCALLSGLSYAKLTTVRPAEVSELRVERVSDGATVSLPAMPGDADLMQTLLFQLEEPYDKTGPCAGDEGHLYRVSLFIGNTLDTEVILNEDGSACRKGSRYAPAPKAEEPVRIADWAALFEREVTDPAQPQITEPVTAGTQTEPETKPETKPEGNLTREVGSMNVTSSQGAGNPFPEGTAPGDFAPVAEAAPWTYYTGELTVDGQACAAVWRDNPEGEAQWLCVVPQPAGESALAHSIRYEGGSKQSNGRFLYFTITDALNYHASLWVLDTQSLYFNLFYGVPCSNFVIPENPSPDLAGMGWVVHEYYLIPIELAAAAENTGGIIDLAEYYDVLEEELFRSIGDWGTHKFVRLTDLGGNALQIENVTAQPEDTEEELLLTHQIDVATLRFE